MHALIIGATGATGSTLLSQLLADDGYSQVSIYVRRPVTLTHPKLTVHVIDFDDIASHQATIRGDVLFCCLGTTLKDAGSQEAQWRIDHTYQYQFAKFAKQNGVPRVMLVSSGFANADSRSFYMRMKGQLEQDMMALGFDGLDIFRPPALIRPKTDRIGEKISLPLMRLLAHIPPLSTMRPMPVSVLAEAMIAAAKRPADGVCIIEAKRIWQLAG